MVSKLQVSRIQHVSYWCLDNHHLPRTQKKSNSQYWLVSNDRPSEIDGSKKESLQFADMTK